MRWVRQWGWLFLPMVCAVGCVQCSFSGGNFNGLVTPWQYRTQYAFWNEHYYEADSGGGNYGDKSALKLVDRKDTEDGVYLFVLLFGFTFDYQRDFNTFTAEERNHFTNGMRTQPLLWASVSHAEDLGPGDELSFDSEDTSTPDRAKPRLAVYHTPGTGTTQPWSDYPDELKAWGTHVKATLRLQAANQPPLPGPITGTIEYDVSKGKNDPDDVLEGSFTTQFTADVIKERLGLCNYYAYYLSLYGYFYSFYMPDGCASFRTQTSSSGGVP